jgi:hypothetical protein
MHGLPKVKVKLSLSLTKSHIMKIFLLNLAHHEDIWGSGGIVPHILSLGT